MLLKKKKKAESIERPKKATWKMSVEMKNSIKGLENYYPTVEQTQRNKNGTKKKKLQTTRQVSLTSKT